MRHCLVVGQSGVGKSTCMLNMIADDLAADRGVIIIDPLGAIATPALNLIPPSRAHHLVYLKASDLARPVGLNLLESLHPDQHAIVADDIVSAATHAFGAEAMGHRSQDILRMAVRALCATPGTTLVAIMRLLLDEAYRRRIVARVSDPLVRTFWIEEYDEAWTREMRANFTAPLLNKLRETLGAPHLRHIWGQPHSSFSIRRMLDEERILIVDLAGIGEGNARLFGSFLVSAIGQAALSRADTPPQLHRPAFLFVDEYPQVAGGGFKRILAMARNVSLSLVLAQQYLSQVAPDLRNAVLGAAGNVVALRAGADDAKILAEHLALPSHLDYSGTGAREITGAERLVALEKYRAFARIPDDPSLDGSIELELLPPPAPVNRHPERLINRSRSRYGRERTKVEEAINRFLGPKPAATAQMRRRAKKALGL